MNNSSTVAMISLGCPKNLVNSEEMLALLQDAGYAFTDDLAKADAAIINTCAFIESAKTEAIEKILETASYREENPELKIIVSGCLAQRYADDIRAELPEVDGIMGTGSYSEVVSVVEAVLAGDKPTRRGAISAPLYDTPRAVSTGPNWAYLRIAEGCDNRCAYCVIPSLRGKFRSRTKESILEEARLLAASGVKELIIVAQDITRYGIDLYGKVCLTELLKELCKLDFRWVRLHYLYPELIDDELIDELIPVRLHEIYLGRYLFFGGLALLQATLVCAGDILFFGIQCDNPLQFVLAGWVASLVFSNIVYTLTVSFGDIGKALAVVLLVMQVGGSGGTFPIEMTGPVFQAIYPFLPFTHGINAMHAAMAGAYHMEYWVELGILASYLIPSLALGVVFRRPVIKANDWIIEKLESTKLI